MVAIVAAQVGRPRCSWLHKRSGTGRSATRAFAPTIHAAVLPTKGDDAEGGTGLLDRPGLDRTAVLERPRTDSGEGARDRGSKVTGGGNFRLLLLDDPGHTEPHVVKVITRIVPGVDDEHAKNCFHTARQLGMAIILTCLKEHAAYEYPELTTAAVRVPVHAEPDATQKCLRRVLCSAVDTQRLPVFH